MKGKLNVVLHGTLAFIEEQNFISVLVPDMEDEHVYLAGEYEKEGDTPLERGRTYVLDGVQNAKSSAGGPQGDFAHLGGVVVYDCARDKDRPAPYCEIVLPWPENIVSARGQEFGASDFKGAPEDLDQGPWMFSSAVILTYTVTPGCVPGLIGHPVKLGADESGVFKRLHVFAEAKENPPTAADCAAHVKKEFGKVAAFFPSLRKMEFVGASRVFGESVLGIFPDSFPDAADSKEIWELLERKGSIGACTCGCKTCCSFASR